MTGWKINHEIMNESDVFLIEHEDFNFPAIIHVCFREYSWTERWNEGMKGLLVTFWGLKKNEKNRP